MPVSSAVYVGSATLLEKLQEVNDRTEPTGGKRKGISSHEGKIRNSGNKHCDCRYRRGSLKSNSMERVLLSKSTRRRYNEIH